MIGKNILHCIHATLQKRFSPVRTLRKKDTGRQVSGYRKTGLRIQEDRSQDAGRQVSGCRKTGLRMQEDRSQDAGRQVSGCRKTGYRKQDITMQRIKWPGAFCEEKTLVCFSYAVT
ncbi:MAG: hypothetical protein L6Q59_11595 [Ignavibacteriaceae bacterium]|nr:hypothetical protein [Ignavibacteriaceae bacterium]